MPALLALSGRMFFADRRGFDASIRVRPVATGGPGREMVMTACHVIPPARMTLALVIAAAAFAGPAAAQTPLKLALDGRLEGPSAFFALGLDKGYFKAEGLD